MEQRTLKSIFEVEAKVLDVVVLNGIDDHDAHAHRGNDPTKPEYVMLPGGVDERAMYAAGLHELGHIAMNRQLEGAGHGRVNTDKLADDVLSGKVSAIDAIKRIVRPSKAEETMLARVVVGRTRPAVTSAYVEVIEDEQQAWRWATDRVEKYVDAEDWAAFEACRVESLQSYTTAATDNARLYYELVAQQGKTAADDELARLAKRAIRKYLDDEPSGCGTCKVCRDRADRKERAEKAYEAALIARQQ